MGNSGYWLLAIGYWLAADGARASTLDLRTAPGKLGRGNAGGQPEEPGGEGGQLVADVMHAQIESTHRDAGDDRDRRGDGRGARRGPFRLREQQVRQHAEADHGSQQMST